jgi:ubiquinone/menaquinone biosynthesis C-methylase UbiE
MTIEQALFRLHEGLPRNAPGSEQSTLRALRRLGRMPRGARAIDMGCGNGASALVLARKLKSEVVAVDAHEPYLSELKERCEQEELSPFVVVRHADFAALDEPEASFDLLWSEGAAYVLGFENALVSWRPLLKSKGRAAITELSWIVDHPSDEAKEYWSSVYPGMRTVVGNCAAAERAGYTVIDTITLTNKDWNSYYNPVKQRIAALRAEGEPSAELAVIIEEMEREIGVYEQHGDQFGYVFYLLERQGGEDETDGGFDIDEDVEAADDVDDSDEDVDDEETMTPSRRGSRLLLRGGAAQAFDEDVATVDTAAHRAAEARFAEIVAEIGLDRATRILESIRCRVQAAVERGK